MGEGTLTTPYNRFPCPSTHLAFVLLQDIGRAFFIRHPGNLLCQRKSIFDGHIPTFSTNCLVGISIQRSTVQVGYLYTKLSLHGTIG